MRTKLLLSFLARKRGAAETRKRAAATAASPGVFGRWVRSIALGAAVLAGAAGLRALEIALPQETARLVESSLPGYGLAQALCMTCHSADYIKMQPVSSRAFWQGSVTKMQKVFGAQIPASAVEPIVDYLVKTYGNERGAAPKTAETRNAPPPGQTATK